MKVGFARMRRACPRRWLLRATAVAAACALVPATAAAAHRSPLRALKGAGACLALQHETGCARARGFTNPNGLRSQVVSSDGRSLYVASDNADAVGVVRIDPHTGRLRQEAGAAGCLVEHETGPEVAGCAPARGFAGETSGIAISRDGRFVYISSQARDVAPAAAGVSVFARDAAGRLHQLAGADGCVADRAVDGCAVVPNLGGYDISLGPGDERAYVGGHTFTVLARDRTTGILGYVGCESDVPRDGCGPTPLGLAVKAPTWVGSAGYASAFGPTAFPLLALRIAASGLTELLPGPGGCRVDVTYLRRCAYDARLSGYLTGLVPTGSRELVGFSSGESEVPAPPGTPFQLWSLRLGTDGALSGKGAHCLSTTRHWHCRRAARLRGGAAITGNAHRLYVAGERGVTAVARSRSGDLRVLGRAGGPRDPLEYDPTGAVITPDGRFVYVIAESFYGTGSIRAYRAAG